MQLRLRTASRQIREMRNTGEKMTDTLWKCEQWRAGKVYNKVLFNTQAEAESFAAKMRGLEPDLPWMVEPIQASQVWN